MTQYRVEHNKNYTVINNTIVTDSRLSWKAKGIWLYAFSRPDNWSFYKADIIKQSKDSDTSVDSGLKELEECGYLIRIRKRDERGRVGDSEWTFFETPKSLEELEKMGFTTKSEPKPDFPDQVNPEQENVPLQSTNSNVLPKSKGNTYKDNVLRDGGNVDNSKSKKSLSVKKRTLETVSSFQSKRKTLDAPRRWNLSDDEINTFNFLDGDHIDTDQGTKAYWAKKYSLDRIIEVFEEAKASKGVRSIAAYMQKLLKSGATVAKGHAGANKEFAEDFKRNTGWQQLVIMKKYVKVPCGNGTIDIDFNMQPTDFAKILMNKHANRD